jgi:LytR cell envelope-related transcriptional attenuator
MNVRMKGRLGAVAVVALALGACGSDGDSASSASSGESSGDATTVIVANGNEDNGSAARMTDALRLAGFSTGEPTNSQEKVDASIVYFSSDDGAEPVAQEVAVALGGVDVLSLPDPAPTDSGTLEGGGVLLLLGQNEADKTLEELSGGGGSGGGDTTTTTSSGGGSTTTPAVGGTVKCDEASIAAGIGDDVASISDFQCDEGWAGATYTNTQDLSQPAILEAEGQFWILQDWTTVCEGDTQVPVSLRIYCPGG